VRLLAWAGVLACVSACAHKGAGSPGPSPGPSPPPATAADTSGLYIAESVHSLWVLEVRLDNPAAEREVGVFGRTNFIARFENLRQLACGRGTRLVIVTDASGAEDIKFHGQLRRVRVLVGRHGYDGLEIPC
jgi:hypothetical protein